MTRRLRRPSVVQREALNLFRVWRAEDVPLRVSGDQAFRLTDGMVGAEGDEETRPLAAVAVEVATIRFRRARAMERTART